MLLFPAGSTAEDKKALVGQSANASDCWNIYPDLMMFQSSSRKRKPHSPKAPKARTIS
jgi:hypothetical protein